MCNHLLHSTTANIIMIKRASGGPFAPTTLAPKLPSAPTHLPQPSPSLITLTAVSTSVVAATPAVITSSCGAPVPSSCSPRAASLVPTGQSKFQRWKADSPVPSSGISGLAARPKTFKAALLSWSEPSGALAFAAAVSKDGWQLIISKRARSQQRKNQQSPHRPVPEDLQGRFFNCLASTHRVAFCRWAYVMLLLPPIGSSCRPVPS